MPHESHSFDAIAVLTAFTISVGLSVALVAWLVSRAIAAVPEESREYKDVPPLGFRLVWQPVQWVSHFLGSCISGKTHQRLLSKLRQAGVDYSINPTQYIAARIVGAAVCAVTACLITSSLDKPQLIPAGISGGAYLQFAAFGAMFGWIYPALWLKDRLALRRQETLKSFPFYLDIITLCVEAGLNMQGAMNQAVDKGPGGVLRDEFRRVLRDIRAGKPRAEALRHMADRLNQPCATNFVSAVIQAEAMGMNLGPILRAQADQRRAERFLRAEKLAMEAPVKMLFPLIAFIFPCTFIVLFFPIVMQFMQTGL
ncbi:MAG: tadC [Noviherbaspirillum sp.]|jgi:tight adherence protein C|nr:tadC [Noviherbaspirillum sp.]